MAQRLGVKIIMNAILIPLLFLLTTASVTQMIIATVLFSIIAFLIGDQWILRKSNNTVATIADAAMAGLYFWLVARYFGWGLTNGGLFTLVVLLGVVEAMNHHVLGKWDKDRTAFSERDI